MKLRSKPVLLACLILIPSCVRTDPVAGDAPGAQPGVGATGAGGSGASGGSAGTAGNGGTAGGSGAGGTGSSGSTGSAAGLFQDPQCYPIGVTLPPEFPYPTAQAQALAVGDVNGDGAPDVVAVFTGSDAVSVLRGRGDGSFASALEFPAPHHPWQLSLGDLDGDGKADVVYRTADDPAPDGGVLGPGLLRGGLPFGEAEVLAAAEYPGVPVVADLDGDGRLDVIELASSDILFWKGRGDGTLEAPRLAAPGFGARGSPYQLVDLDRDGKLDLVVSTPAGVSVLRGRGDGTLELPVTYQTGNSGANFALGDLDGDGLPELVAGVYGSGTTVLVTALGRPGAAFGPPVQTYVTDQSPYLAMGDFDGDGRADVLGLDPNHGLDLFPGKGDGTFAPMVRVAAFQVAHGLVVADLNGDGRQDAVVLRNQEACIVLARP